MSPAKDNDRIGQALTGGTPRRRVAGETAGGREQKRPGPTGPIAGEVRRAIDINAALYQEAKLFVVEEGTTIKELVHTALSAELRRRKAERDRR